MALAAIILALHIAVVAFNLFGLIAVPIGARRGWRFVRSAPWRILHLASLLVVAVQALLGRSCFLTVWQDAAAGIEGPSEPLIMRWMNALLFWPLPIEAFAAGYVLILAWAVLMMWRVPPRWR